MASVQENSKRAGIDFQSLISDWKQMFYPQTMLGDLLAGFTVALVALPLNLALALGAGLNAGVGITTGIVAGLIGALLGGQRFSITGPSAAMAVVLVEVVQSYGVEGIWLVGLMAGLLQILAGIMRMGHLAGFVALPVMVGFANGIGILVAFNSLDDFLGLPLTHTHHLDKPQLAPFLPKFIQDVSDLAWTVFHCNELSLPSLGLGVFTLATILLLQKYASKLPVHLIAITIACGTAWICQLQVFTIGDIGKISMGMPMPSLPNLPWQDFVLLFPTALTIFTLGSIESLLSATIADGMVMTTLHKPDQELFGQGLANCAMPFFGGMPVTGVIARTAVNIRAGARTRLSGVVHSLVLLAVALFLSSIAAKIPLSCLSAVLIAVGLRLIDWTAIKEIWIASRMEGYVMLATTATAVLVDLTAGVMTGLALSCALFIKNMSQLKITEASSNGEPLSLTDSPQCKQIETFLVDGPLFFGATERFVECLTVTDVPAVLLLDLSRVSNLDLSGVHSLMAVQRRTKARGSRLVICGLQADALDFLKKTKLYETLGTNDLYRDKQEALLNLHISLLRAKTCQDCQSALADKKSRGRLSCPLAKAIRINTNPSVQFLLSNLIKPQTDTARFRAYAQDRLLLVDSPDKMPENLKGSPIADLLKSHNIGEPPSDETGEPKLIIGMCMDYRKSLYLPKDWAFIVRREGANMLGSEFGLAVAISRGIKYMALIAHNNCAMARTAELHENFIKTLVEEHGWDSDYAERFFRKNVRQRELDNEIDFAVQESKRLQDMFKGLTVIPMLYRIENDKLYLISE